MGIGPFALAVGYAGGGNEASGDIRQSRDPGVWPAVVQERTTDGERWAPPN
jgi:hypothetical protein